MEDLTVTGGLFPVTLRTYGARAWLGAALNEAPVPQMRTSTANVCVDLPQTDGNQAAPEYVIMDLYAFSGSQRRVPARVHLYHLGGTDYRVVGLERPYEGGEPG